MRQSIDRFEVGHASPEASFTRRRIRGSTNEKRGICAVWVKWPKDFDGVILKVRAMPRIYDGR
jgi:hypothetical protein